MNDTIEAGIFARPIWNILFLSGLTKGINGHNVNEGKQGVGAEQSRKGLLRLADVSLPMC
ncbi:MULTISPECIES: hypothetical protein [Rhizobium]|uniref:hypothetical protein n=1 Tax=Rhizobium TaxID=379 RepID=UPI001146CEDE|nr:MULTISPECIES: hypothetical protein [Rhizobium]NTF45117.1 hypothetical protein [Rhizobium rhizogenes]